jgi:hypothetical protein
MSDHITNQPQPDAAPPRRRPDPGEDHPRRPDRVTVWTDRNVAQIAVMALGVGLFLAFLASGVGKALTGVRLPFMVVAFVVGATVGGLATLR